MTTVPAETPIDQVRAVADALLYEGYVLYPYRASASKNHSRWQFGVLVPPGYAELDPSERADSQTECVLEYRDTTRVRILVRFLHVQRRSVEVRDPSTGRFGDGELNVDGVPVTGWDEAVEREVTATVAVSRLLDGPHTEPFEIAGGRDDEPVRDARGTVAGRVVRQRHRLTGAVEVSACPVPGPWQALRLRVRVVNRTTVAPRPADRTAALAGALTAAHTILSVSPEAGSTAGFVSMVDPPEWAAPAVAECQNTGTWPVLAGIDGDRSTVLSSPIILYDHPSVAPESTGDMYDATEIDEILTLRTLALTDEEKAQARATDPRAAAVIDRADHLDAATLDRLHGAVRYLRALAGNGAAVPDPVGPGAGPRRETGSGLGVGPGADLGGDLDRLSRPGPGDPPSGPPEPPWWDPGGDRSVSPETDSVDIGGVLVRRGATVRLRPGRRRADAQDMFLRGRLAVVEAVLRDVDDVTYLAVTLIDDPSADLHRVHGRFLYFAPDEVEAVPDSDGDRS